MNVRNFLCFGFGTLLGLGVLVLFRRQNAFVDPPEWVYGVAVLVGAGAAIGARLLAERLWKQP